ncbi:MAG: alpha/beta hydrolase [bacterium]|nr:alpha/beta hydrolase [bacterium]
MSIFRISGSLLATAALFLMLASCASFPVSSSSDITHQKPVKLHYKETGKGDPVLLLHGLGASSYAWRYVTPELAKTHRIIALDLKGFGQSDKPRDDKYSLFDQAELVDKFIRKHKLKRLTLVGHSFGGGIAMALAIKDQKRRKPRLKKLILIDSISYKQEIPWGIALMRTPIISELGIALIPSETQMKIALQFAYHDNSKIPPDAPREYAKQISSPEGKYALLRTAAQLLPENIEQFTEKYSDLKIKTLLIWCRRDGIVPVAYGKRLYNNLPNARMHILPECVHLPQEELPQLTSKLMSNFLREK